MSQKGNSEKGKTPPKSSGKNSGTPGKTRLRPQPVKKHNTEK